MTSDTLTDVTKIEDLGNASAFASDVADIGGSGHTYSGGFFYPSGNQDGYNYDNANMLDVVELSDRVGGILIQMNLDLTTVDSTTTETLIFGGVNASPNGGWRVRLGWNATTLKPQVKVNYAETSFSASITPIVVDLEEAQNQTISIYFDVSHAGGFGQITAFASGLMRTATGDLPTPFPSQKATRMFSLFNNRTNDGGAVNQELNSGTGNVGINHLRIVSFEYDGFTLAYRAAKEYFRDPSALPVSLDGA
jgi:hypothetical protein